MSGTNQKRSRKSKLVPRSFKDTDDLDDLQDKAPKKTKLSNVSSSTNSTQNQPSTSTYQPLQFDIKIEVEECDEFETSEILPESEIKSEIINENELFEFEERDINSLLARALYTKAGQLDETSDDESLYTKAFELDHDYSPKDEDNTKVKKLRHRTSENRCSQSQSPKSLYHLQLNEDAILKSLDELYKKSHMMTLADKILGVEMRNSWGRCRMADDVISVTEKRVQIALSTWKYWKIAWKGQEVQTPLMYKCYLCEKAWWHLGPFQDHLRTHNEDLRVESESQRQTVQHNIVAYSDTSKHVYKDFKVDGNCWRCGYEYEHHVKHTKLRYVCVNCSQQLTTCIEYRAHEAECFQRLQTLPKHGSMVVFTCHICKIKMVHKEALEQHYASFHDVRSDLPMFVDIRNCTTCGRNYSSLPFHYCVKKTYSIMCQHCAKRFPSKLALDIHLLEKSFTCPVCHFRLRKKCMLAEHMLKHTTKFVMLYKCLSCKENVMLLDEKSVKKHKVIWHKQRTDKRRNYIEMVIAVREFIEAQKLEALNVSSPSVEDPQTNECDMTAEKCETVSDSPGPCEVEIEINPNPTDMEKEIPSTSIVIKQEQEEFDQMIVKEKMIEEMKKNNFTEDDEGYEYILSSVFNASSEILLENQIAEETDDFDEIINNELKKSTVKKNKTSKKQKAKDTTDELDESENASETLDIESILEKSDKSVINVSPKSFKCDYQDCYYTAVDKIGLKLHRIKHKSVFVTCSKCCVSFDTIRSYLTHLSEHGYVKWTCPECLRTYSGYSSLAAHIRIKAHQSFSKAQFVDRARDKITVKYQCKICKETVQRQSLLDHWEKHIGTGDMVDVKVEIKEEEEVDVDGIQFDQSDDRAPEDMTLEVMQNVIASLVQKTKKKHENKTCLACGRSFERRNDTKRHHIEHLLANAYATKSLHLGLRCQICYSVFERADAYKQHMRDHGHLPVHRCNLCFKTFSDSSNYVKHIKTHSSMYICDICNKKFQAKNSIIKHMEWHKTTKPINCLFCTKVLYTESEFSRHVRIAHHSQSLFKFSCIICKKKFKTVKEKWDHMWIQHKERPVQADCPLCTAKFRKVNDVRKHLKSEHSMDMTTMNMRAFMDLLKAAKRKNDGSPSENIEDSLSPYIVVKMEK